MCIKSNNNGFNLIEAIVVLGIVSISMVAIVQLMQSNMRTASSFETKFELNSKVSIISQLFENESLCSYNLKSPNISNFQLTRYLPLTGPITSIPVTKLEIPASSAPEVLIQVGRVENEKLNIRSISIENISRIGTTNFYKAEVGVFSSMYGLSADGPTIRRSFPLFLTTNISHGQAQITACSTRLSSGTLLGSWPMFINCGTSLSPGEIWTATEEARYARNTGPETSSRTSVIDFNSDGTWNQIRVRGSTHDALGCVGKSIQTLKSEGRTSN